MELINVSDHIVAVKVPGSDMELVLKPCGSEGRIFSDMKKVGVIHDSVTGVDIRIVQQINRRAVLVPKNPPRHEIPFPDQSPNVYYIVSVVVREFLPDRMDLLSPDGGKTAEREDGIVVCVQQLRQNSPKAKEEK